MNDLKLILADYKAIIDQKVNSSLSEQHPEQLYESMRYALQAGGKKLRPIITLIVCQAVGGHVQQAVSVAAAIEIVHNFSLVHDDIMDRDEIRRGRETVYKHWNENIAILSGDALLVKAFALLTGAPQAVASQVLQEFSHGVLQVCEGQILDMQFETQEAVSTDEYFEMIDKKTAALFALSCKLGAVCGNATATQIEAMHHFGMSLGRAFQIQDDLLDLIADELLLGKDVGSDLESGKKTFLVLHAMENASAPQLKELQKLMHRKLNANELEKAKKIFAEIGSLKAAQQQIDDAIAIAKESLATLTASPFKDILKNFVLTIENREF